MKRNTRRVQAQRKFAAGIQIPNSRQPQHINSDRRIETPPESRVFQIHTTPSSILDVVSFQGIHNHLQPVVLLKRLKAAPITKTQNEVQSQHNLRDRSRIKRQCQSHPSRYPSVPAKRQKTLHKKKTIDKSHTLIDKEVCVSITPLPDTSAQIKDLFEDEAKASTNTSKEKQSQELNIDVFEEEARASMNKSEKKQMQEFEIIDVFEEEARASMKKSEKKQMQEFDSIDVSESEASTSMNTSNTSQEINIMDVFEEEASASMIISNTSHVETSEEINIMDVFEDEARASHKEPLQEFDIMEILGDGEKASTSTSQAGPKKDVNNSEQLNDTKRINVACPSRLCSSVKQVLCFRNTVLLSRCKNCSFCTKIDEVLRAVESLNNENFSNLKNVNLENLSWHIDLTEENDDGNKISHKKWKLNGLQPTIIANREVKGEDENSIRTYSSDFITTGSSPPYEQYDFAIPTASNIGQTSSTFHISSTNDIPEELSDDQTLNLIKFNNEDSQDIHLVLTDDEPESQQASSSSKDYPKIRYFPISIAEGQNTEDKYILNNSNLCPDPQITPGITIVPENLQHSHEQASVSKQESPSDKRPDTPVSTSSDDEVLSKKKKDKNDSLKVNNARAQMQDAPVFRPTAEEFADPAKYVESILPEASKYGLCKVIPPEEFNPPCKLDSDIRFGTTNQYIPRMYSRWGPAAREMCTIRAHLLSQKVLFNRPPLLEGLEVNLPKLFRVVQRLGGLKNVITKKKWNKVAEELRYRKLINPGKRLDQVYVKFLLPYSTLTDQEREKVIEKVNCLWQKRNECMLERALNPLHRQKRMLDESESSDEEEFSPEDRHVYEALSVNEDCVIAGRNMSLKMFKKIADSALDAIFDVEDELSTENIEQKYWNLVRTGTDHVCVYAASVDTGETNLGFPNLDDPYTNHPWNLKRLSENPRNVLSFLGPVVGMTVPTLHLGMVFSTSCWHRDPHGLAWSDYMHEGSSKLWYSVAGDHSEVFRNAVEKLCPTVCQNKSIWLPSDIAMIPPELLQDFNIPMCRAVQNPGEYIIVAPKAYSCSIATNFTISESVYFATNSWLHNVYQVFRELSNSCEPAMFSLEQLLLSFVKDPGTPVNVLKEIHPVLTEIVNEELSNRRAFRKLGYRGQEIPHKRAQSGAWNVRDHDECEICRMTLYLSKVTGIHGKKSVLCIQHARTVIEKKNLKDTNFKKQVSLDFLISSEELSNVLKNIETRLSN